MGKLKKTIKWTLRFFLLLIVVFISLLLILHIPAVQDFLTGKVENYLEDKLQTTVNIESIRFRIPKSIALKNVYVEDLQKDTLINIDEFALNFHLSQLFSKRIQFNDITLKGGDVRFYITKDSTNIDFIINAFNNPDIKQEINSVPEKKIKSATAWQIFLEDAQLIFKDIHFQLQDFSQDLFLISDIGFLKSDVSKIDFLNQNYTIDKFELKNSKVDFKMNGIENDTIAIDTTSGFGDLFAKVGELSLDNIDFLLHIPSFELDLNLEKLELKDIQVMNNDNALNIQSDYAKLKNADVAYGVLSEKRSLNDFDYNYLDLEDINLELDHLDYSNGLINGNIKGLSAKDKNGFELKSFEGKINITEDFVEVENISLITKNTVIKSNKSIIPFSFTDPLPSQNIQSDIRIKLKNINDLTYFYPDFSDLSFSKKIPRNSPLELNTTIKGSLKKLDIPNFSFKGLDSEINLVGNFRQLDDLKKMNFKLSSFAANINGEILSELLMADSLLPENLILPDFALNGYLNGSLQSLNHSIALQTKSNQQESASYLKINGNIQNLSEPSKLSFDINIDSLHTTNSELLTYLPKNSLPESIQLPEIFNLKGKIKGTLSDLQTDLQLSTERAAKKYFYDVAANIGNLSESDSMNFDVHIKTENIPREEIHYFLPDSLLPSYVQLPNINKFNGSVKGNLKEFASKIGMESEAGNWVLDAELKNEKYQANLYLNQLKPEKYFIDEYLDSLIGFSLEPLSITIKMNGQETKWENAKSNFSLLLKRSRDNSAEGLVLNGTLDEQNLSADIVVDEKGIRFNSNINLDLRQSIPKLKVDLSLDSLDLASLGIMKQALSFKGGTLNAEIEGTSLDTLSAKIKLNQWSVKYDTINQEIDSLYLFANLDNGKNIVSIFSDICDAEIKGEFDIERTVRLLEQQFQGYFNPEYDSSLLEKTDDQFDLVLKLKESKILASGLIPGLTKLDSLQINGRYDNALNEWELIGELPAVSYQGTSVENVKLNAKAKNESIDYQLDLNNIDASGFLQIKKLTTKGTLANQTLKNNLSILDEELNKIYAFENTLLFLKDGAINLSFSPSLLLDNQEWNINQKNEFIYSEGNLFFKEWDLSKEGESLQISNKNDNSLDFVFDDFNLKTISNLAQINNYKIHGILNGQLSIQDLLQKPIFTSDLSIKQFTVLDVPLGDFNIFAEYKNTNIIGTQITLKGEGNDIELKGHYDLLEKINPLDMELDITSLSLPSMMPFVKDYVDDIKGKLAGKFTIKGSTDQPNIAGKIAFKDAGLKLEMLKSWISLGEQDVIFNKNKIEFDHLQLLDEENNKGMISSYIQTDNFRTFNLNAQLNIKDFIVLNTTLKDNSLYYGKLIVDADANIRGTLSKPEIEIFAQPKKGSSINYILDSYSSEMDFGEGIVEFVSNEVLEEKKEKTNESAPIQKQEKLDMKVVVKLSIDKNLDVKVVTDPFTGDFFKGKVEGDLLLSYYTLKDMSLTGSLALKEGKYLFTYQKLIRRTFDLVEGGTIKWQGDPYSPELDISVDYKVKTTVFPLLVKTTAEAGSDNAKNRKSKENFLVRLSIGGTLENIDLKTSILYPSDLDGNTNDTDVQAAINEINQNTNQQNTQAFSLILFNGFLADDIAESDFNVLNVSQNINNAITQQLNKLANKYIKFVELDIGFDQYQNSDDKLQTDLNVSIRKRFLNDRLTISIDGKTKTEADPQNNTTKTYIDNITVEYAITPDGRMKIKIYNKYDLDDFIGEAGLRLGGAFVFSKEFNSIRLSKRKNK